jgi:aryl-alcohol dehydrogenase-like predicted oxidoreductase
MQNCYNLLYREEEREMILYCLESGIANIHYSPLAGGLLISGSQKSTERATIEPLIKIVLPS